MCRAMRASNHLIPMLLACSMLGARASASPEDDLVAEYLRSHDMLPLLEVQLEQRMGEADDEEQRDQLAMELSRLYLRQLGETGKDDPYRQIVLLRAEGLVSRLAQAPLYELRLELLIDEYVRIEPDVELWRLGLLDPDRRDKDISRLGELSRKLGSIISTIEPELELVQRRANASAGGATRESDERLGELRRYGSLAHYYHAWAGYSLAVLRDMHVSPEVFVSFGWLLGAEGSTPQISEFNESALGYEHVARAAIGVAMSYAQSQTPRLGRPWAKMVADSELADGAVRQAARERLLQIYAMERDWAEANRYARFIVASGGDGAHLRVADARFLALRALEAQRSADIGHGGANEARGAAQFAIEQLIDLGEIGHVVDLYQRFDSLPLVSDGFIPRYAHALAELDRAQRDGDRGQYGTVADLFTRALGTEDAGDYPEHREDCRLKLAYTQILANRPQDAIRVCDTVIGNSLREKAIEEARWMRIAAIDQLNRDQGRDGSPELSEAVRRYIEAYPSTPRSAKLILRYAMQGTVDPRVAISTLEAIGDDDPIALPARRALAQLRYQALRESGFADQRMLGDTLGIVEWILAAQSEPAADLNDARARLGTIRIGLDMALRARPPRGELARSLLERGTALADTDASLASFRAELVYRRIELSLGDQRVDEAMGLLADLETLDPAMASNARVLLLSRLQQRWGKPSAETAERLCDIGSAVLASMTPPFPEPIGLRVSAIAELVSDAAAWRWENQRDPEMRDLALRVARMVLERGQPSEPGLRRTAALAASAGEEQVELDAWLMLLAAYPSDDARWYEARFESLRLLKYMDPTRAEETYKQFRVLHPDLGPEPWSGRFAELYPSSAPVPEDAEHDGETP